MNIVGLLDMGNWVFANKTLIRKYGCEASILIGHFCSLQNEFNGWFYQTYEQIEHHLGIKEFSARKAIHSLIQAGLVYIKREGLPCKTYYLVDEKALMECFDEDKNHLGQVPPKSEGQDPPKSEGHYILKKEINKKEINKKLNKKEISKSMERTKLPKKKSIEYTYQFFKDEFEQVWFNEYLPLKKRKKASTTEEAIKRTLNKVQKFSGGEYDKALQILTRSVDSGWTDLYELPVQNNKPALNQSQVTSFGSRRFGATPLKYEKGIKIENPFDPKCWDAAQEEVKRRQQEKLKNKQ